MLVCPHCNQEIEFKALKKVSWWNKPIGGPSVSLGWSTLIIMAIIVATFSNSDSSGVADLSRKVGNLTVIVEAINTSVIETP